TEMDRRYGLEAAALVRARDEFLMIAHRGELPIYWERNHMRGDWRLQLPAWAQDQRNQMTGPADDAALVVKMLNSGAPGVMIDFEDSVVNRWPNLMDGHRYAIEALRGRLTYEDAKRGTVGIRDPKSPTAISTRVRGLHLQQCGVLEQPTSAMLFDIALHCWLARPYVDRGKFKHPLFFYIPKTERVEEGAWLSNVFDRVRHEFGWPEGSIVCMALVESHPLAYRIEEYIWEMRRYLIGLNLGRWDYMASLIHHVLPNREWVFPDRNTIPHDVPFFQNLRGLIPTICHRRGILAIGGMTALYPSRTDSALNERALAVLEKDKRNEAACLFDGAWTGHPDQNAIAVAQFPEPNQLCATEPFFIEQPDLRPRPDGVGETSLNGTCAAIRTVIRYRHGALRGLGASLLDGYMEDLATDRIYRLMIAQRVFHGVTVRGENETFVHTPAAVQQLFQEETDRLIREMGTLPDLHTSSPADIRRAAAMALAMVQNHEFTPA
ncbi:MAG: hypothetical protein HYV34_00765, partial [Candidatus Kerfeldbacteria bacterium]|nr:hypothetical protein [Candidatus Kerfeldbacteria bacterium]